MDNLESVALNTMLSSLRKRLQKDINDALRPMRITSVHAHYMLALVTSEEQLNLTELSAVLDVDKANTTRVVAELTTRGLVEKIRQSPHDRRFIVLLTDEGKKVAEHVKKVIVESEQKYLTLLEPEAREVFLDSLEKMSEYTADEDL